MCIYIYIHTHTYIYIYIHTHLISRPYCLMQGVGCDVGLLLGVCVCGCWMVICVCVLFMLHCSLVSPHDDNNNNINNSSSSGNNSMYDYHTNHSGSYSCRQGTSDRSGGDRVPRRGAREFEHCRRPCHLYVCNCMYVCIHVITHYNAVV